MLPPQGVSEARNALLPLIGKADIVVFPDDDCWYAPDTQEQVVATFRQFPAVGALLGTSLAGEDAPSPPSRTCHVSRYGTFRHGETYLQFFRAEGIRDIRFDPRLGPGNGLPYGCGEDTDFLLEAYKRIPILRCPGIRVFHASPATYLPPDDKITSYAAGRMFCSKSSVFRSGSAV